MLVTVLAARRLPDGLYLPATVIVDRTCLGAKQAMTATPCPRLELQDLAEDLGKPYGGMEQCEPILIQSVLFHAIDYARGLGFGPHPDLDISLFGPRPEALLETPLCKPNRPIYVAGPYDNVPAIVRQLEASVGAGNFDFVLPDDEFDDDLDDEDLDDDDFESETER